jgi:beta-lactam-binding protein with PASTA domain
MVQWKFLYPFADDFQNIYSGNALGGAYGSPVVDSDTDSHYGKSLSIGGGKYFFTVTGNLIGSGSFSMEARIKITGPSLLFVVFESRTSDYFTGGFIFYVDTSGKLALFSGTKASGITTLVAGTEYHVRITGDGSAIKGYLNGSLEFTKAGAYNFTYDYYYIGRTFSGDGDAGRIHDFRLSDSALNTGNFTPPGPLAGKFATTFSGFGAAEVVDYQIAATTRTIADTTTGNGTDTTLYRYVVGDAYTLSVTSGQTPLVYSGETGTVAFSNTATVALAVLAPDSSDNTQAEFEIELTAAGLILGTVTTAYSETVAIGVIISQDPAAGTAVEPGSAVDIVVSLGTQVPDVVGMDASTFSSEAFTTIEGVGLYVNPLNLIQIYSETVPLGYVIAQDPVGGTGVEPSSEVILTISLGPEFKAVPDVVGQTEANGQALITAGGLANGNTYEEYSETQADGIITSSRPVAGTLLTPGTAVDIYVSRGPQPVRRLVSSRGGVVTSWNDGEKIVRKH